MKSKKYEILIILILLTFCFATLTRAQDHGDALYRARNDHSGNLIRVTYHNHGMLGSIYGDNTLIYAGEWPINSGQVQMGNASSYVTTELSVIEGVDPQTGDTLYAKITPVVFCQGWDPGMFSQDSLGKFLGFEPLPGYYNVDNPDQLHKSAMSHLSITWPPSWPDKLDDVVDPGWRGEWNGYFGKGISNADQESYHVLDDYQFKKKIGNYYLPPPIQDDLNRGGLGLRQYIRGLQWSNPDAQDAIFWIYKIKNIGETRLARTVFGLNVGASMGAIVGMQTSQEASDDAATFYRDVALTVNYDWDNIGIGGYSPVPWAGFAFLESPGNAFDGIDNDGDGIEGSGPIVTMEDFFHRYSVGDDIVLIDYDSENYERTVTTMPQEGISFTFNNVTYNKYVDQPLEEIPRNGMDDNLNGIIDESDGVVLDSLAGDFFYIYIRDEENNRQDYRRVDYFTSEGLDNLLIDERRDDGIDNDGDWNPLSDDVGLDGLEGTADPGEGDGLPTPGVGDLPGEPNIDKVDVTESDQIGLTSFVFYEFYTVTYSNDEQMWDVSKPGYFDDRLENVDADYVFATGYFPLMPNQDETFSICMVYGIDEEDILRNKDVVQVIYNANYNFAVAPKLPTVTAVAGDGKVLIYWDDVAEESKDRFLHDYDFEGYKIYRATDPGFTDAGDITDGYGYPRFTKPIAVYDKADSVSGFFPRANAGVQFFLGNNTGLRHYYEDTGLVNGVTYFYAVTAYDTGSEEFNITPSETNKFVAIDAFGGIMHGINVAAVTPTAPSAGYQPAGFDTQPYRHNSGAYTTGQVMVNMLDPDEISEGGQFEIQFMDVATDEQDNDGDGLVDADDPDEFLPLETSGMILKDVTDENNPQILETVLFKEYRYLDTTWVQIKNLFEDDDKIGSTLTYTSHGMEFFINIPEPGLVHQPQNNIYNGTKWSANIDEEACSGYPLMFNVWEWINYLPGIFYPRQYKIVFFDELVDTSAEIFLPREQGPDRRVTAKEVNFIIYDLVTDQKATYGFQENLDSAQIPSNHFSSKDEVFFVEELTDGEVLPTFYLQNAAIEDTTFINEHGHALGAGDTLYLYPDFGFNSNDRFRFSTYSHQVDNQEAKDELENIKVVPNPYVVTAAWEPRNPYSSGRGDRSLHFIHLPPKCTIRVYSIDGKLIQRIEHDTNIADGSAEWDMLSKDQMEISYGLYIYHVEAPEIGEHIGRFLVIK